MAGNTGLGGGTDLSALAESVSSLVSGYSRSMERIPSNLETKALAHYLDKGLPLMWACFCPENLEREITARSGQRAQTEDWVAYTTEWNVVHKKAASGHPPHVAGHLRMIIGYNPVNQEIAISDSWGKWAGERGMTVEEARLVSQDYLLLIK